VGQLKIRNRSVRVEAVVLAAIFILSAFAGAIIAKNEVDTGGVQAKWTFSGPFADSLMSYSVLASTPDGTTYVSEEVWKWDLSQYPAYLLSIDPNGHLNWKSGCHSVLQGITVGTDGKLYYSNIINSTDMNTNNARAGNLTCLDSSGNFVWSYVAQNGSLVVWGTFPDGTVIAMHTYEQYDPAVSRNMDITELFGISPNGSLLWTRGMVDQNDVRIYWPITFINGSLLMNGYRSNASLETRSEIALGEDGKVMYTIDLGLPFFFTSVYLDRSYEVQRENVNGTSRAYLVALSIENGSMLWKTRLGLKDTSSNPNDQTLVTDFVKVDGNGILYCSDLAGRTFAVAPNGQIMWDQPSRGELFAAFHSGGLLIRNQSLFTKLNSDGHVAWQCEIGLKIGNPTIVVNQDTIYIADGTNYQAFSQSGFSNNLIMLTGIVILNAAAIVVYLLWSGRRTHRSVEKTP
jgi:outer membrane protein assembly factor BamB